MSNMRFYLVTTGDSITIRSFNHELLALGKIDSNTRRVVNTLIDMTEEQFLEFCLNNGVRFRPDPQGDFMIDKEQQDWYEKAWMQVTENTLARLKIAKRIPEIDPKNAKEILATLRANRSKESIKKTTVNLEDDRAVKELTATLEPATDTTKTIKKPLTKKTESIPAEESKKPLKKLEPIREEKPEEETKGNIINLKKKIDLTKKPKEDNRPTKTIDTPELLQELLRAKKITLDEYKERRKRLAKPLKKIK